jgi:hypothetical protein
MTEAAQAAAIRIAPPAADIQTETARDNLFYEKDETVPGLYNKANKILNGNAEPQTLSDADSGVIAFDPKSGISQEDQKDIVQNIDHIMQSSKIKVSPDLFRIKAQKKGVGFPFFVNVAGIVILAAGVFVLWFFFQQNEAKIASGEGGGGSEALREILATQKQQAEEALKKKNEEILGIQSSLDKVNGDLSSLKENMSSEIAAKENDIKTKYDQELEAERKKLIAAGAASGEVDRKLRELQEAQNKQLQAEMVAFKRDMEARTQERERALLDQQRQFNTRLESATNDRKKLSAAYEEELRKSEEQLGEETRRNRLLAAQKEKFDLIDQQIVGFYRLIQEDIGAAQYPSARKRLQDLRDYLVQPAIMAIPEVARRSEVEAFVIDSLESLIAANERQAAADQKQASADAQSAQGEAKIVTEIRKLVLQADEAYRAGNKTRADGLYLQALELIPEINKSHDYLMGRVNEVEAYRKSQVAALLGAAGEQCRNKQYDEALATYGKALEYLPTDRNAANILAEIKTAAYEAEASRRTTEDSSAAVARLKNGNALLAKGEYNQAIVAYLELLRDYPKNPATAEATAALGRAIKLKEDDFSKQIAALQSNSSSGLDDYKKEIDVLKKTVADREKELAALKGTLEGSQSELTKSLQDEQKKRQDAEVEVQRLQKLSDDYVKLQTEYATYSRNEDGVVRTQSLEEMALGKSYLDSFLSSKTVQAAFPGLLERIKRYDRAFERAGRNSALADTLDVIKAANALKTKAEKIDYLQKKAAEAQKSDPTAAVLLKSLIELISA